MVVATAAQALVPNRVDGLSKVVDYLSRLVEDKFWGQVTLRLDGGKIVVVKEERTRRPEDL
ncbi:MAG: hypothetical protein A2Y38_02930 [Spirochaetes bacterium GWB1_59_5]|nr:MAG: hypothetical protein A2Y38_02930 [Spirochaetes bacterium GWB1_59_5]